jgi:hypothetical protein
LLKSPVKNNACIVIFSKVIAQRFIQIIRYFGIGLGGLSSGGGSGGSGVMSALFCNSFIQ